MEIQAVSSVDTKSPDRNFNVAKINNTELKPAMIIYTKKSQDVENTIPDNFENSQSTEVLEKKYDLACRLAAYYKSQYDSLLQRGYCRV